MPACNSEPSMETETSPLLCNGLYSNCLPWRLNTYIAADSAYSGISQRMVVLEEKGFGAF